MILEIAEMSVKPGSEEEFAKAHAAAVQHTRVVA